MMDYFGNVWNALKEVYTSKYYFVASFFSAMLIYSLNILIHNYKLIFSSFSFSLIFSLWKGGHQSMGGLSVAYLIIVSILASVLISMSVFLVRRQIKTSIYAGSSGIFASIFAPACGSCALGVLSMIGLGGFLAVLPLKGLELGIFGIIIVVVSLFYLSNKIVAKTCSIS